MEYVYAVLGAGRQGTASAYDMARCGLYKTSPCVTQGT